MGDVSGLEIEVDAEDGSPVRVVSGGAGPETVLAVTRGFGTRIVTTVIGAVVLAVGGTILAIGIAVTTFVLRHRAKRRSPTVPAGAGRPPTVG